MRRRTTKAAAALRRLHSWLGMLFTVFFLLLVVTGVLVQHRERFGLADKAVSRRWLPAGYRSNDPGPDVRADIVITDLHSGRLFGPHGPLAMDLAAAAWALMMASGYGIQWASRFRNHKKT